MPQDAEKYYQAKLQRFADYDKRVFDRPKWNPRKVRHIHILGICGSAMSALAGMLVQKGYTVSGSDEACYPPMSNFVRRIGARLHHEGYHEKHVGDADLIVVGNVIRPDNTEARYARENKIPQITLPEALQTFCFPGKRVLVVAGTHGKTTTTALLVHLLKSAGRVPSYLVGGILQDTGANTEYHEESTHFIIEGDEYDTAYFDKSPKFLNYTPTSASINVVEFDHADIYDNMADYQRAFSFFADEVSPDGTLVLYGDDPNTESLRRHTKANVITFGLEKTNDLHPKLRESDAHGQVLALTYHGEPIGDFMVPLSGAHNVLNTLAALALAHSEGLSFDEIREGLRTFKGVKRRQEVRAEVGGVVIVDDFAHHPTAVKKTIEAMRNAYPEQRVVAVFEPRSNTSRTQLFEQEYGEAFDDAHLALLCAPTVQGATDDGHIRVAHVVDNIIKRGVAAHAFLDTGDLLETLKNELRPGDVALVMSNGDFDDLCNRLITSLHDATNK